MSAAVGKVQLRKLEKFIETRRNNAKVFKDLFSSLEDVIIQKEVETSSWFGFSIVLNNKLIDIRNFLCLGIV